MGKKEKKKAENRSRRWKRKKGIDDHHDCNDDEEVGEMIRALGKRLSHCSDYSKGEGRGREGKRKKGE